MPAAQHNSFRRCPKVFIQFFRIGTTAHFAATIYSQPSADFFFIMFLIQGTNFALTYPRCPIPKDELIPLLSQLVPVIPVQRYVVGRELHQEPDELLSQNHLHVVLGFGYRFTTRDPRRFDVRWGGSNYHPNVTVVRSLRRSVEYAKKDGDFIESDNPLSEPQGETLSTLCATSTSKEEFLSAVIANPSLCNRFNVAIAIANYKWEHSIQPYVSMFNSFPGLPLVLRAWAEGSIGQGIDRPRSLVVWSTSSGLGKTEWARSLGRHVYWCGQKDLSRWDPLAEYVIMDDIEWQFVPDKKQFFGAQKEFTMTDKYKGKKTVKWGKPFIFLCNYDPLLQDGWNTWYNERALVIEIDRRLYYSSDSVLRASSVSLVTVPVRTRELTVVNVFPRGT